MMPYSPEVFTGTTMEELRNFTEREFKKIATELGEMTAVELRPVFMEPVRPREGMLVFADGVSFNPGSGRGTYERRSGAWVKL